MKRIIFISLCMVLTACVNSSKISTSSPYNSYSKFLSALKFQDQNSALNLLSNTNQVSFNQRETNENFFLFFPFFSSVDTVVPYELDHFSIIRGSIACLTVVGSDASGEPTSLSFELFKESDDWKLNFVELEYYESKSELPKEAMCPKKV